MSYTDAQWAEWCRTFDEPPQATQAAQLTVINNYFFVDASINIQAIINPGNAPARIVDNRSRLVDDVRRYLPPNYQPTNDMEEAAQKLLTPMTKEEQAASTPWQCF